VLAGFAWSGTLAREGRIRRRRLEFRIAPHDIPGLSNADTALLDLHVAALRDLEHASSTDSITAEVKEKPGEESGHAVMS
jgi:hypothetical protein